MADSQDMEQRWATGHAKRQAKRESWTTSLRWAIMAILFYQCGEAQHGEGQGLGPKECPQGLHCSEHLRGTNGPQAFIQQDVGHSLKEDQKILNQKRKLAQRIERLKTAQKKKAEQWIQFRQQVKDHVAKEKLRYETECQELAEALKATQLELDKAMSGEPTAPDDMETEKIDSDVEEIFSEDKDNQKGNTEEKAEKDLKQAAMEEAIMQTQAGQMMLTEQLSMIQTQMTYMANILQAPSIPSPTRQAMGHATPTPSTPGESRRRSALEPFARAATTGPYATPEKVPKDGNHLEQLDGYGPAH